jgi:hypothetical protein
MGFRVDLEIFLNQYVRDRPLRCLTSNLSETGIYLNRAHLPTGSRALDGTRTVGLEFELPGTGELIWARGEICHESSDPYFCGSGIRFTGIPTSHARMVRDFCVEARRDNLGTLLHRIRAPRARTAPTPL